MEFIGKCYRLGCRHSKELDDLRAQLKECEKAFIRIRTFTEHTLKEANEALTMLIRQENPKIELTSYELQERSSDDRIYPCDKCGKLRSKAEGGTTFTVCDKCWDAQYSSKSYDGTEGKV